MLKKFALFLILLLPQNALAALPFVTDDAGISQEKLLTIEEYNEYWHLPSKDNSQANTLFGQYLGLAYGAAKNLEISTSALISYDFSAHSMALSNPSVQFKRMAYVSADGSTPDFAMSAGYVNKNGMGQYYDPANNFYVLGIASKKFLNGDVLIHLNTGAKASFDISGHDNVYRPQLGIGFDIKLMKNVRILAESYNGAPNSPRDSPGYFHSYQCGFRFIRSETFSLNIMYGTQPTFLGYDGTRSTYRQSEWVQFGMRKVVGLF